MSGTIDIDLGWFALHPDRQYRLRKATRAEVEGSPKIIQHDCSGWVLIRRSGMVRAIFGARGHCAFDDYDEELSGLFEQVRIA